MIESLPKNKCERFQSIDNGLDEKPIVALLPGSRKQEIKTMLSVMLSCS